MVELNAFNIVGISTQTSNANEITEQAKIPQLWDHFYQQNIAGKIAEPKNGNVYGLYSDYETDVNGIYNITLGVEVNNDNIPADLVVKMIPAAKYLVLHLIKEQCQTLSFKLGKKFGRGLQILKLNEHTQATLNFMMNDALTHTNHKWIFI